MLATSACSISPLPHPHAISLERLHSTYSRVSKSSTNSFSHPFSSTSRSQINTTSVLISARSPLSQSRSIDPSAPITITREIHRPVRFAMSSPVTAASATPADVLADPAASAANLAASGGLVACFGEMLIDFVPTVNGVSLVEAPAFMKAPGGAPANVAVGIARLGGRAAFMGKVGEDEFGHMLAEILKTNSVDTSALRFDAGARTALAFVTLKSDGAREFMFYRNPSADMLLRPDELDLGLATSASVLHYGSISLITDPCRSAHLALLDAVENSNSKSSTGCSTILSYDPNLRIPLWPSPEAAREGILSIWDRAHIIKVSDEEVAFLTNGGDPYSDDVAWSLFNRGGGGKLKLLLVTEGSKGCRYYSNKFSGRVDGFQVETIDTTGAGDAFVAGFLRQVAADGSLLEDEARLGAALRFANACGAITTTVRGAIPALPDGEKVAGLMN